MTEENQNSDLRIDVQEQPAWRRVIDIEVGTERVEAAYRAVYKEYQKKAKIPGFRPGKVPLAMVQKRFQAQAHQDVLEQLVPSTLSEAYRNHKLYPITDPEFSDLHLKPGEPLKFRATIEVRPEVEPKDYTGLELKKPTRAVSDADIDGTIERIREQRVEFNATDQRSARGDLVICDMKETSEDTAEDKRRDLKDVSIVLDPERVFPEIADGLTGAQVGETRNLKVVYPEEYGDKELAGRTVTYDATVKEVKVKALPELNADFLKTLAGNPETVDQLKDLIRADLEAQIEEEARRALRNAAIAQVVDRNRFELPSSLIGDYLARLHEDLKKKQPEITAEQVDEQYREMGERQVRWEFLYHAIAEKESIAVTEEDINAWLDRFAQNYGMTREDAKKQLAGANQVQRVRDTILENKVLDYLLEQGTVTELPAGAGIITPPGAGGNV